MGFLLGDKSVAEFTILTLKSLVYWLKISVKKGASEETPPENRIALAISSSDAFAILPASVASACLRRFAVVAGQVGRYPVVVAD